MSNKISEFSPMNTPRYTGPEVLKVTHLKPETLQTWVNRNVVTLAEQNPGRGKRRLYSAVDVVKLAIMRRCDDLKIALSISTDLAESVAKQLENSQHLDWDFYVFLRPQAEGTKQTAEVVVYPAPEGLDKYDNVTMDPFFIRLSKLVESHFEGIFGSRRKKSRLGDPDYSEDRPVIPEQREEFARAGFHGEPVIVFPLGEIVNGTLAQLRVLDEVE